MRRPRKREAILIAAREAFLENGYAGTSMSDIAARVGGSKVTLYGHFKCKDDRFAESVLHGLPKVADCDTPARDGADVWLARMGEALLARTCSREWIKPLRLVAAEARQAPQVARAFYRATVGADVEILATALENASRRGELSVKDARCAAEQFVGLCLANLHIALLLDIIRTPAPEHLRAQVRTAAAAFMKAHAPRVPACA